MTSTAIRRKEIAVAKRLQNLQKLGNGVSADELDSKYGVRKKYMYRYRRNAAVIRQLSENPTSMDMKRKRTPLHVNVDTRLYVNLETRLHAWVIEKQALGCSITDSILQKKAIEFDKKFGCSSNFTASSAWLCCFIKRYNLHLTNAQEERADTNELIADKFIDKFLDLLIMDDISEEDIYNMDETSLLWRALPQTISMHNGDLLLNSRKLKNNRVTVALCANATATHKLAPLLIKKQANPRALKHCKHILPVLYKSQNQGLMDEAVFNDWYMNHFKPSVRQHQRQEGREGKVLLVVDNFRGHMLPEAVQEDSHFEVIFLPSNTSTIIQPMEQGVIQKWKKLFRYKILGQVFRYNDGVTQFYAEYDIKACINLISEAWTEITAVDIKDSWDNLLARLSPVDDPEKWESEINSEKILEQLSSNISPKEVTKWISKCEEEESTIENTPKELKTDAQFHCEMEEQEIYRMFYYLEKWAETKPNFVKAAAKTVIKYYNKN